MDKPDTDDMKLLIYLLCILLPSFSFSDDQSLREANRRQHDAVRTRLLAESNRIAAFAQGPIGEPSDPRDRSRFRLLEAAGEYCRANKLKFDVSLPEITAAQAVIFAGQLPGSEEWAVVFRSYFGGLQEEPLELHLLTLHPIGKRPVLPLSDNTKSYAPKVLTVECKGLSDRSTVWVDHDKMDLAVVALSQGRPSGSVPWFKQTVGKYRIQPGRIQKLWLQTAELYELNFDSSLDDEPVQAEPPRMRATHQKR